MVSAGLNFCSTKVWRYQRGNQNPYIEEKENVQKDKQRSRKHKHKAKDRIPRTPLKNSSAPQDMQILIIYVKSNCKQICAYYKNCLYIWSMGSVER